MALIVPWYTSDSLIAAVKRKISFPISQQTFTEDDILLFANEELMLSQVPSIMQYHEEFFVTTLHVPLVINKNRYAVPNRAIGMKLRALFWEDTNNNLYEMARVHSDDRAFFQNNPNSSQPINKYYFEGNEIVLTTQMNGTPTGNLVFVFYLRPNQLVQDARAASINGFSRTILVDNTTLIDGDTVTLTYAYEQNNSATPDTITFTARTAPTLPTEFLIGPDSITTATNLTNLINSFTNTINVVGFNGTPSTTTITTTAQVNQYEIATSNVAAFTISTLAVSFTSVPTNFSNKALVDFLQTDSGHRTYSYDVQIPVNGIQANLIYFNESDIPAAANVGDYVCLANECIIPQIPSDLHNGLAERTCARILAALGDAQGLGMSNAKLQEIEQRQATLIENRSEGDPLKVNNQHSLLRYNKMGTRRRL